MVADGVLVVFDSEGGSFRDREAASYKAHGMRDFSGVAEERNPFAQLASLKAALDFMRWRHCEIDDVEADDVIAAYVRALPPPAHAVIVSGDSDMLQLVSPRVSVVAGSDRVYGPAQVVERYGVTPAQMPLYKALAGDAADTLPGVRGIGRTTARAIVQRCASVDDVYAQLAHFPPRSARLLADARDAIEASLRLVTLDRPVPLPYPLERLAVPPVGTLRTMEVLRGAGIV